MSNFMKLFGRALEGNDYDYQSLLNYGIQKGFIVHPKCSTNDVKKFLDSKPDKKDFSQTFYKSWDKVKSMTRYEQFIDQIIYYYTGQNPNNLIETDVPKVLFENLKPILPINVEEACKKCEDMLASGIALAKDTIKAIFDVFDVCKFQELNIDKIKNREARLVAFKRLNKMPTESSEFLRFLVYSATDETMLIKNKEMLTKITKSHADVSTLMKNFGLSKLSTIYGRYKLIFMAFKHANKANISCINRLTKVSKKPENKPTKVASDYFQTFLSNKDELDEEKLKQKLKELNNYKKIALLETINLYVMLDKDFRVFSIRNSKVWVKLNEKEKIEEEEETEMEMEEKKKEKYEVTFPLPFKAYKTSKKTIQHNDTNKLQTIYAIVYDSLVTSLRSKHTKSNVKHFTLPNKCVLTAPRSEKAFIGEYPFGSSLPLAQSDLVIGISWNVEDNARDIDLSLLDMKNQKIGWNSHFTNKDSKIMFSGDVVQPPGTELIYAANGFDFDSVVCVNLYGGINEAKESSFKFFIASEKIAIEKMTRNYMINPNSVLFSTKITMESKEMLIGFLAKDKFIFSTFRSNDSRVSQGNTYNRKVIEFNLALQKCHLDLRKLLADVGLNETMTETDECFRFDSKADIIGFFKN